MPSRLRHQPLRRIDQDHSKIAVRRAGRHVARILLMTRRISDDEMAARCREITIGDVDGDALLALGLETVEQKREIDILAGRTVLTGIALQRGHMIVEDQTLLIKQPPDQRRLSVINGTTGEKAKRRPRRQQRVVRRRRGHQK